MQRAAAWRASFATSPITWARARGPPARWSYRYDDIFNYFLNSFGKLIGDIFPFCLDAKGQFGRLRTEFRRDAAAFGCDQEGIEGGGGDGRRVSDTISHKKKLTEMYKL